jgi:hypothetical protein
MKLYFLFVADIEEHEQMTDHNEVLAIPLSDPHDKS